MYFQFKVSAWGDPDTRNSLNGRVQLEPLTGARVDGMHHLMRNLLPAADARRSLRVRVLDARHRATVAGAEVRVYAAGTRRLIGARIVDSGSGYDGQNDLPLHFGLGTLGRVDVEVAFPGAGHRVVTAVRNVRAAESRTVTLTRPLKGQ